MRILYVAMKYDFGKPAQGFSFEHCNFYDSLRHLGMSSSTLTSFRLPGAGAAPDESPAAGGRPGGASRAAFHGLFGNELDRDVIRQISRSGTTVTLNWFCDDHWRFEDFSRHWAPCFNWVVTTSTEAVPKYAAIGYTSVIKSQWGCNHHLYRKLDLPLDHDVTFVGQPHGDRREIIERCARRVWR